MPLPGRAADRPFSPQELSCFVLPTRKSPLDVILGMRILLPSNVAGFRRRRNCPRSLANMQSSCWPVTRDDYCYDYLTRGQSNGSSAPTLTGRSRETVRLQLGCWVLCEVSDQDRESMCLFFANPAQSVCFREKLLATCEQSNFSLMLPTILLSVPTCPLGPFRQDSESCC